MLFGLVVVAASAVLGAELAGGAVLPVVLATLVVAPLKRRALVLRIDPVRAMSRASLARVWTRAGPGVRAQDILRLERDLHDGVQGRLLALAFDLRMAQRDLGDPAAQLVLTDAAAGLAAAIDELRALVKGNTHEVLSRHGLRAALAELTGRMPVPVTLNVPATRLPPQVETWRTWWSVMRPPTRSSTPTPTPSGHACSNAPSQPTRPSPLSTDCFTWWPGELVGDLDMLDWLGRDGGGDRQRRAGRGQVGRCLGGGAGADAVLQAIGLRRGI
ncbi:histidine kinase [Nonomuraea sp. NPDC059023]|uniref:histidine kinase n=1 Tax=Nonomuraea sp. NPDC059023 TaxID=3346706 RepID=UPI0036C23C0C